MSEVIKLFPTVEIIRLEESLQGTIGSMQICKQVFCWTLEPPDYVNLVNKSSIPDQQYICIRYTSSTYGETFKILDVPERSDVIFHWGNDVDDTRACILLGQYVGSLNGNRAVLNSRVTFTRFMKIMSGVDRFILTIKKSY